MLTRAFLREHGLAALCDRFHIKATRHGEHPNLVHLKYSQIDSPMGEAIVQECRGLILDEADDWAVVCYPYRKFFNAGEGHAAPIDWSTARVYEKLDGSLMTMYHYRGKWHVSSSGMPDAAGPVFRSDMSFAQLFWKTWEQMGYAPIDTGWEGMCFMFELMTPLNRVIVHHARSRLVLHGARLLKKSGYTREVQPRPVADVMGWECVQSFPLTTFDECCTASRELNPIQCEGYVVVDGAFNRQKIKSPQYVALAHLKEGMSAKRLLEINRANESSEFLTHFPEWADAHNLVREAYVNLVRELEAVYSGISQLESQKDFALEATKTRCSPALFALRAGKCKSVKEYLATASINAVARSVNLDGLEGQVAESLLKRGVACTT